MSQVAIVTGAGNGIGRAVCLLLSGRGIPVVLCGRRNETLEATASMCETSLVVPLDLTVSGSAATLVAAAREWQGGASPLLVNSIGWFAGGDFESFGEGDLRRMMDTNATAPLAVCQAVLPWMLSAGGSIVNVASIAATHVLPGAGAYCASKAALLHGSRVLAQEVRSKGVRVGVILPGATHTEAWGDGGPPREDMLTPEAVASAIVDMLLAPPDRAYDELVLMPPKGIL